MYYPAAYIIFASKSYLQSPKIWSLLPWISTILSVFGLHKFYNQSLHFRGQWTQLFIKKCCKLLIEGIGIFVHSTTPHVDAGGVTSHFTKILKMTSMILYLVASASEDLTTLCSASEDTSSTTSLKNTTKNEKKITAFFVILRNHA